MCYLNVDELQVRLVWIDCTSSSRIVQGTGSEGYADLYIFVWLLLYSCGESLTEMVPKHSSPQLINDVYTNVDPVLCQAVNLLPVAEWL